MAGPILVPCLALLRTEVNTLAPARDKGADGWIGDAAHRKVSSDHNPDETGKTPHEDADNVDEVHALDVDATGPWPAGKDLTWMVETIRGRALRGLEDRLQYIIWQHRIASKDTGWGWHGYTGTDPHTGHAHFSAVYTSAQEADVRPWGLLAPARPALVGLDGYALPVLEPGADDADDAGYHSVARAQQLLGWLGHDVGAVDGVYGPRTVAAVKALVGGTGRKIDLPVWVKLYGLSKVG